MCDITICVPRSLAYRKNAAQRNTVTVSRCRAFLKPAVEVVITSRMYRFSSEREKIIVDGISTIRAISWRTDNKRSTENRSVESGTSGSVSTMKQFDARVICNIFSQNQICKIHVSVFIVSKIKLVEIISVSIPASFFSRN